jgi:uncharacterized membrane protein
MRRSRGHTILQALSLAWCGGIFAPCLLHACGLFPAGEVLARLLYSPICHQDPSRTMFLAGAPLTVCARCTAIYVSGTIVVLLAPILQDRFIRRVSIAWLCAGLAPMGLDVLLSFTTLWHSTMASRVVTGALAGIAAAAFLIPNWEELSEQIRRFRTYTTSSVMESSQ